MRTTVKRLGLTLGLAALVALAPAAAASASSGGGGITVPTGPGGPPISIPIQVTPWDVTIYWDGNPSGCIMVLTHNELVGGTYTGNPPGIVTAGTKIRAKASTTAGMSAVIDYSVTCAPLTPFGTISGLPVDTLEFRISSPYLGPTYITARSLTGVITVNISDLSSRSIAITTS